MPILDDIVDGLLKAEVIREVRCQSMNASFACVICGDEERHDDAATFRHAPTCPVALAKQWKERLVPND